jgi:diaminopimelate decarboxylase
LLVSNAEFLLELHKIIEFMTAKTVPFTLEQIKKIISQHPTPFHIYDEKAIRENARNLLKCFSWNPGFKEFFAVKANPNPYLMKILKAEGFGSDCSSLPELLLSERTGITGENIMFSSNNTPASEFKKAKELGAIINLDDLSHISYLEQHAGLPDLLSLRFNPGSLKEGNQIIGNPEEAKYGFTQQQLFEGYKIAKEKGVKRFGLHTMVASNELNPQYFVETAQILFNLAVEIKRVVGIDFDFINLGGGIGIPYHPEQDAVDMKIVGNGIKEAYKKIITGNNLLPIKIYLESGRMIAGPYGYLVSKVQHIKKTFRLYAGLDASMQCLMRPAIYGAYHHITVMGKETHQLNMKYDITGSLCENNDKFAIQRKMPELKPGDILIIHDTGAHGYAMGFNYNGKLRPAELLLRENKEVVEIRRPETADDYFATLDFKGLGQFSV